MNYASLERDFGKIVLLLLILISFGCSTSSLYTSESEISKNIPVTDPSIIVPGLKVYYYDNNKYLHITDMPKGKQLIRLGRPGKPVSHLNNIYSKKSNVFGSGKSQLIGFFFLGMIHLDTPGTYSFQALANDGIRVYLDHQFLLEDPFRHSNRLTPIGSFEAEKDGWYPVQILYFQRKGTAALRFFWKKPNGERFEIVPASALGHMVE